MVAVPDMLARSGKPDLQPLKRAGAAAGHAELSLGLELAVEIGDRQHLAAEEIGRNRGRRLGRTARMCQGDRSCRR